MNRKGYPNNAYKAQSFTQVINAKNQFASVDPKDKKMIASTANKCATLLSVECQDLEDSIQAVKDFIASGPDYHKYPYDSFMTASSRPTWKKIAGNGFTMTSLGSGYLADMKKGK